MANDAKQLISDIDQDLHAIIGETACGSEIEMAADRAHKKAHELATTIAALESEAARLTQERDAAREALRPFAARVFNDNGDVTYDTSSHKTDDYWRAYIAMRDKRPAPPASEGENG